MSHRWMAGCALALGSLLVASVGCFGSSQKQILPPSINASAAGEEAIKMYDKNADGKISGDELDKCPALKSAMAQIDPSGQGQITAETITARIKKWQASQAGLISLRCTVLHNGEPLEGATVTFVPEKFLGENVKPGKGKTDQDGVAVVSEESTGQSGGRSGIATGFYRVVVTKEGMTIPPQYSSEAESVFGHEAANDAADRREGIKFDMKF